MRLRSFLLGMLTTLLVVGGIQLGVHLLSPSAPKLGTNHPQNVSAPIFFTGPNRIPDPGLAIPEVPRHWGPPRMFNGVRVYIEPLATVGQAY